VDLDEPLPAAWVGRLDSTLSSIGILFGKSYEIGGQRNLPAGQWSGSTTNGDYELDRWGTDRGSPIAPESTGSGMTIEACVGRTSLCSTARAKHNNGWFVVRSLGSAGATKGAIEWVVRPHAIRLEIRPGHPGFPFAITPSSRRFATIELDRRNRTEPVTLVPRHRWRLEKVAEGPAKEWGRFLR